MIMRIMIIIIIKIIKIISTKKIIKNYYYKFYDKNIKNIIIII